MCRGVGIAADDDHPRLRDPSLRSDNVKNPLPRIHHADDLYAQVASFVLEPQDQLAPALVGDAGMSTRPIGRRDEVVGVGNDAARPPNR